MQDKLPRKRLPAAWAVLAVALALLFVLISAVSLIAWNSYDDALERARAKVSSAVHLRFDIAASTLPEAIKARLLLLGDQRVSKEGVVVIKAQEFRSLDKNRAEALRRLQALVDSAAHVPKARRPTRPTRGSVTRRLEGKARRGAVKAGRGRVE